MTKPSVTQSDLAAAQLIAATAWRSRSTNPTAALKCWNTANDLLRQSVKAAQEQSA